MLEERGITRIERRGLRLCLRLRMAPRRLRRGLVIATDIACVAVSVPLATALRYDFRASQIDVPVLAVLTTVMATSFLVAGWAFRLYRGRYGYSSFEEVQALVICAVFAGAAGVACERTFRESPIPRSVPVISIAFALILQCSFRYAYQLACDRLKRPAATAGRAIVFGAGDAGRQLVTSMLNTPESPYVPVAMVDDDPGKQSLRVRGIPVMGTSRNLPAVAREVDADALIIAIPSAGGDVIRRVSSLAAEAKLPVKVLPSVVELFGPDVTVDHVRPISESDLLGRREIDTDLDAIASYLTDKRVLVTGAGGSIGSELCRQLYRFAPASLVMVDRDESALHATQLAVYGRALLESTDVVVADIRDSDRIAEIFAEHRPQVVFHAAALKHLPLLELYPSEGTKTNVWGTMHVLAAAIDHGVERFVNISTDKAADPQSVLGNTKRITERLTAWASSAASGTFLSVRFGNVLGSRGSVLTAFRTQIASGGPVTVTHPDVTRYFMTVEEAVQLVIQAGSTSESGAVLVLEMGEPVRIDDVATRLIQESGKRIDIVYTGLRPGEKLHEDLFAADEARDRTDHPLIYRCSVPPLRPVEIGKHLDTKVDRGRLAERLAELSSMLDQRSHEPDEATRRT